MWDEETLVFANNYHWKNQDPRGAYISLLDTLPEDLSPKEFLHLWTFFYELKNISCESY